MSTVRGIVNGAARINIRNGSNHDAAAADRSAIAALGSAKPASTNGSNHDAELGAATKNQPAVVDAEGEYLKPEEFLKAYQACAKEFDVDVLEDERGVLFCKKIRLMDAGDYTAYCPQGVFLVKNSEDSMLWDAWIRKVPHRGHQNAVIELGAQLRNYALAMSRKLDPAITAGGGHEEIGEVRLEGDEDEVIPEWLVDPDITIRVEIEGGKPQAVLEVELSNRDPLPLAKHVHGLMSDWEYNLRCVIGLKIYKRSEKNKQFACVCFVWKKRTDNTIYVERVFDIGPKQSNMKSKEKVAQFWTDNNVDFFNVVSANDSFDVEGVNIDYPLPEDCPDGDEDYFTVTIEKNDIYYGSTPTERNNNNKKKVKYLPDLPVDANLEIDLFPVLKAIDKVKTKNFK